jgi:hypothetical protein
LQMPAFFLQLRQRRLNLGPLRLIAGSDRRDRLEQRRERRERVGRGGTLGLRNQPVGLLNLLYQTARLEQGACTLEIG